MTGASSVAMASADAHGFAFMGPRTGSFSRSPGHEDQGRYGKDEERHSPDV
jgi:hypothetical protein